MESQIPFPSMFRAGSMYWGVFQEFLVVASFVIQPNGDAVRGAELAREHAETAPAV